MKQVYGQSSAPGRVATYVHFMDKLEIQWAGRSQVLELQGGTGPETRRANRYSNHSRQISQAGRVSGLVVINVWPRCVCWMDVQ